MRFAIPALVLVGLLVLLGIGLTLDPRTVPSPLVGKPAPRFDLPTLEGMPPRLTEGDLRGAPVLVNFWASWCAGCQVEHPLLMELSQKHGVPVIGMDYKDEPAAAQAWLARHGNPYRLNALDQDGRAGLDWGVYGVPETFVVDAQGTILYKQVGPVTREAWEKHIRPLLGMPAS